MLKFDLTTIGQCKRFDLNEIEGRPTSVVTCCSLQRTADQLVLLVEAEDENMMDLDSSVTQQGQDPFLFEEDCLQIATAMPGTSAVTDFLLVNPHDSRSGTEAAMRWTIDTQRHSSGWRMSIEIPIPTDVDCMGISLHRFYRGIRGEVQGHGQGLPHPLNPAKFAVVVLRGESDLEVVAENYRRSVEDALEAELQVQLAGCRKRLANADGRKASIETAKMFVQARLELPVAGLWNETYLQHALIDLWEIERDPKWLELAIPRMEDTWELRADRQGRTDTIWNAVLPTWHYPEHGSYAMSLVSGVMLYPMARLMHTVHSDSVLKNLWPQVEQWGELCREVIDTHQREWVELPGESGMYIEPYPKGPPRVYPSGGSRIAPLNRAFWLAMPMLHIARVLGVPEYVDKVTGMARYFMNVTESDANGSLVWEYESAAYPSVGEDISHAHSQLLFAELCCQEGIVITEDVLKKMAVTLDKNVFRHTDVPCNTVRGLDPGIHLAVGAWSSLCRYVPHVFPRIIAVVETMMAEGNFDFRKEGWAVRILTMVEKARMKLG